MNKKISVPTLRKLLEQAADACNLAGEHSDHPQIQESILRDEATKSAFEAVLLALDGDSSQLRVYASRGKSFHFDEVKS